MKQPEIAQWWPIGSDNQEELIIWLLATIAMRRHPTRRSVTLHDLKQNYHWIITSRLLLPYTDTVPHPISYVAAGNGFTHCGSPYICMSPNMYTKTGFFYLKNHQFKATVSNDDVWQVLRGLIIWLLTTVDTGRHPTGRSMTLHDFEQNYCWIICNELLLPYIDASP